MNNNIEFENGTIGTKAIIKGLWQSSYEDLLIEKEVKELELNDGKGWRDSNVDFLKSLPNLKSLIIIDFSIKSIEAIYALRGLLKLEISTYCKTPINFKAFPNLVECGFEWIRGSDSLFEIETLQTLFLNNYDKINCDAFSTLINLKELSVLNSKVENLRGLSALKNLKALRIGNLKNLESLKGIEDLYCLEKFEIQRCKKIGSISEVFKLKNLKKLSLIDLGNIHSLKGIENLTLLTTLMFYESTNILDGDLLPITKLKNLSKISFKDRKHYTHKRQHFGDRYA